HERLFEVAANSRLGAYSNKYDICKRFRANQLTLNVKKSNFLLIGSSSRLNKNYFFGFILSLFDYGDMIFGDRGNASLMSDMQVLHNKAARLI
ncbi:unnamed protein product, partial [Porites lobata]